MAARKQPAKKAEEPKEEITQIEVISEPECSVKVRPDLYERMMKIGGNDFWAHVLENQTAELAKRYRR